MAKKHHMTKHEYVAHNRKHRYAPFLGTDREDESFSKSTYTTQRKKSETEMKNRLRSIRRSSDDMPDFDEEDDPGLSGLAVK
jgi:hypothetical protein